MRTVANWFTSRMSLVIFLSRLPFPVLPLPAATMTIPDIWEAVRSKLIDPDCTWNVPLTTSWVVLSFILTSLASGLTAKV